jgi:hypothetical protein
MIDLKRKDANFLANCYLLNPFINRSTGFKLLTYTLRIHSYFYDGYTEQMAYSMVIVNEDFLSLDFG